MLVTGELWGSTMLLFLTFLLFQDAIDGGEVEVKLFHKMGHRSAILMELADFHAD